jgi:hypothetical protein
VVNNTGGGAITGSQKTSLAKYEAIFETKFSPANYNDANEIIKQHYDLWSPVSARVAEIEEVLKAEGHENHKCDSITYRGMKAWIGEYEAMNADLADMLLRDSLINLSIENINDPRNRATLDAVRERRIYVDEPTNVAALASTPRLSDAEIERKSQGTGEGA